jgi:hypothetical protein
MTTVAERGLPARGPSGHALTASGCKGLLRSLADSPGCCMLMNIVRRSGVMAMPVTSHPRGPVRKRRISADLVSAHNI